MKQDAVDLASFIYLGNYWNGIEISIDQFLELNWSNIFSSQIAPDVLAGIG